MTTVAIIIPIYKKTLTKAETISLERALHIFFDYPIVFITYKELDTSCYDKITEGKSNIYTYSYFDQCFFNSISGYNELVLRKEFYHRFIGYNYILIYQLDSYVFSNQLDYWLNQEYDYIGAPWIIKKNNQYVFEGAGNGGFSLRKTDSFYKVLNKKKYIIKNPISLKKEYFNHDNNKHFAKKTALMVARMLGYRNNLNYYIKTNERKEDLFWAFIAPKVLKQFTVAPPEVSIKFSFEKHPEWCYKQNNNNLPFACHGWLKINPDFWKQFIPYDKDQNL